MKSPAGSTTWLPTEHQIYCVLIATPSKEPSIPAPLQHGLPSCENTHGSRTRSYDNPPERRIRTHSRWIKADRIPHPKIWCHTSCYQDIAKTAEAPIFVYFIANDSRTKSSCFSPSISNRTYHHSYNPPHLVFVPRNRIQLGGFDQDRIASIGKCKRVLRYSQTWSDCKARDMIAKEISNFSGSCIFGPNIEITLSHRSPTTCGLLNRTHKIESSRYSRRARKGGHNSSLSMNVSSELQ